jgi:CRP/FNR family cyclic AMP-dependent transcriptional regulator
MMRERHMTVSQTDKEAALAGHFLLRHLRPEELRLLAASTTATSHKPHTTIFQKGEPGDSMMAVIRGRVKICAYSVDGKEFVLNIIDRGGLFGEIALLDGQSRTADAVTLEETDLLVLTRGRFLPFLTAHPELTTRLFSVLCQRLRQTSEHLEDTLFREAASRVARALLRLAATFGQPVNGQPGNGQPANGQPANGHSRPGHKALRIDIKLSQQQLGNLVGISRESVNKHLGEWSRADYLGVEGGIITIFNREALESLAEAEQ